LPGLLAAVASGLVLAAAVFAVMEAVFSRTQAGSEYDTQELAGRTAEVITSIRAGGTGEITYVVKGQRERASARARDGEAIAKGAQVEIESMVGSTAYVRRADGNVKSPSS
jgi:membrane-bound ClpP family serine protease